MDNEIVERAAKKVADRIRVTKDGFNYIKVTYQEILRWGGFCVCDRCNGQFMFQDMYLVFILGDCFCEKCFNEWKEGHNNLTKEELKEDLHLQEEESLNWYMYHLDDDYRQLVIRRNEESNNCPEHIISLVSDDTDFEELLRELDKDDSED